ncbi:hypothetical protein CDAR_320671 [Caerostris darwini]|uniref:Uncharacterized protein n=1 Tax=Caerostris darwini TaxID=1538125 RepID=A0AAV4X000_9ARAC|nr:hypothetical protein CDAR_320671 [Caerostris darwini]
MSLGARQTVFNNVGGMVFLSLMGNEASLFRMECRNDIKTVMTPMELIKACIPFLQSGGCVRMMERQISKGWIWVSWKDGTN